MPLNNTPEQVRRSAAKDHAKKLAFESALLLALRPHFNVILNDFRSTYAETGNFPDITEHNNAISAVLNKHYDRVSDSFSDHIEQQLGEPTDRSKVRSDIQVSTQLHKNLEVPKSGQFIANTNQSQMHDARDKVIVSAAVAGLFLTNKQIANRAHAELSKKYAARLPLIALDNTQNPAEQAKQAEYESLIDNEATAGGVDFGSAADGDRAQKQWVAVLDNKTRPAHADADGQIIVVGEPFIVGGEKLMYPRDTSLGASMANVANCRCSAVPVVQ
jgi:uncharacterized protein with gpF-like domain